MLRNFRVYNDTQSNFINFQTKNLKVDRISQFDTGAGVTVTDTLFAGNGIITTTKIKASDTNVVGGSWVQQMFNQLTPTPLRNSGVSGFGIAEHATQLGETGSIFQNRAHNIIVWLLTTNDVGTPVDGAGISGMDSQYGNAVNQAIGVIAWNNSSGTFYPATGTTFFVDATSGGVYPEAVMNLSSVEGTGATFSVNDTPGWFLIYLVQNDVRILNGKIEEGTDRIDYGGNQSAFTNKNSTLPYDIIPFMYFSRTGVFTGEFWTSSAVSATAGFVMGALKVENPKTLFIFSELGRFDAPAMSNRTLAINSRIYNFENVVIQNILMVWRVFGGVAEHRSMPVLQYMMADELHLDTTNQTEYLNAQWVNDVLE